MTRNAALIFMILLTLPIITACGSHVTPFAPVTILPEDCHLFVNEELSLTLDGFIPPHAVIRWVADQGDITFVVQRLDAVFVAPPEPAVVTISATVTSPLFGTYTPMTRQCAVTTMNKAPDGLAQAENFFTSWLKIPQSAFTIHSY